MMKNREFKVVYINSKQAGSIDKATTNKSIQYNGSTRNNRAEQHKRAKRRDTVGKYADNLRHNGKL